MAMRGAPAATVSAGRAAHRFALRGVSHSHAASRVTGSDSCRLATTTFGASWDVRRASSTTTTSATSAPRSSTTSISPGRDPEVAAAVEELLASERFAAFGPDTLAEARNRGYRPTSRSSSRGAAAEA